MKSKSESSTSGKPGRSPSIICTKEKHVLFNYEKIIMIKYSHIIYLTKNSLGWKIMKIPLNYYDREY